MVAHLNEVLYYSPRTRRRQGASWRHAHRHPYGKWRRSGPFRFGIYIRRPRPAGSAGVDGAWVSISPSTSTIPAG